MATWKCKDGRVLDISAMTTDHIKNCIAMMRRKGFVSVEEFRYYLCADTSAMGDGAYDAFENEMSSLRFCRAIDAMEAEVNKREKVAA